jgi:hypothetical protein
MTATEQDWLILFRPVGFQELELIRQSRNQAFPPRLPEQPIFYPVLNEEYAIQIARDWNAKYNTPKCGYVTRFRVRKSFMDRYELKTVGGEAHQEYWIPAEDLNEFNQNLLGEIEVIAEFEN